MARSLDLPEEVKARLDNPRAKVFSTLERVFDSTVGREYLKVEPDPDHGLRGTTSKAEFVRGFAKVVTDLALNRQSSRTLNTSANIRAYFESWSSSERPSATRGSFVPADVISGTRGSSTTKPPPTQPKPKRGKNISRTVLPRTLKVRVDNERLIDIRTELVTLDRHRFPNAGAVLLRVFLELAILDYLGRTGELTKLVSRLETKTGQRLRFGVPEMRHLSTEITRIAKERLPRADAHRVEKALKYDASAPFTISDLHAFVHSPDMPGERDILQFWLRTEPLFRMMLEDAAPGPPH